MSSFNPAQALEDAQKELPQIKARVEQLLVARYGSDQQETIREVLDEIEAKKEFSYQFRFYPELPGFLDKEPYLSFLKECEGVLLVVCTLGWMIERSIRRLQILDLKKAFLFDQASGLVLEFLANAFEKQLADQQQLEFTWRFCPGYSGSDLKDNASILEAVGSKKVSLSSSFLLRPSKSMAGFVGIKRKSP